MASHLALINGFPQLGGLDVGGVLGLLDGALGVLGWLASTVQLAAIGLVGCFLLAGAFQLLRRWRRQAQITVHGRDRGLGEQSAAFLGALFAGEGLDAAETMLGAPDLLRARLARELRRRHRNDSAAAYAARAAHLLEELNSIPAPFPGAPSPFLRLALQDAADPRSDVVTAWVLAVDERNITLISRHDCDWPMRRELLATPPEGHGEPFRASLLLRPVPPRHEWVLTHDLVDVITNRRAAVRVPCCLHTFVLPDSGDTVLLRERLADQEAVPAEALRRLHDWAQRHAATVIDVSSDGARVEVEHEVALRDRFHVMFVAPGDRLAGLPLAEVVSLNRAEGGRVAAGVRFIGMRLKERTRLAEFVRSLAAGQGGAIATAARLVEGEETSLQASPARPAGTAARGAASAATEAKAAEAASFEEPEPGADADANDDSDAVVVIETGSADVARDDVEDQDEDQDEPKAWRAPAERVAEASSPPGNGRAEAERPSSAQDSTGEAGAAHEDDEDDDSHDESDDEKADAAGYAVNEDEHRRAMERLRLGIETPLPDPIERPFEYEPRFIKNPFATSAPPPPTFTESPAAREPPAKPQPFEPDPEDPDFEQP